MIHDGYTLSGSVTDGAYTLRFRYRPMLSPERRQFLTAFNGWPDAEALTPVCDWLRLHLASPLAMSLESIYHDDRIMFASLRSILVGVQGGDDWSPTWERDDVANLRAGVRRQMTNPGLANRTCGDCQKWLYDEDTGQRMKRFGLDILRPEESAPACRQRDGCPLGTPEKPKRMSARNKAAYQHFRLCEAIGRFPDDPIVARNALVIRNAMKAAQKELTDERRSVASGYDESRGRVVATHGGAGRGTGASIFAPFGDR